MTTIVVTGIGATSPLGGNVRDSWEALLRKESGIRPLTEEWVRPVKEYRRLRLEGLDDLQARLRAKDRAGRMAWADVANASRDTAAHRLAVSTRTARITLESSFSRTESSPGLIHRRASSSSQKNARAALSSSFTGSSSGSLATLPPISLTI